MQILKRSLLFVGVTAFALTACKDDDAVAPNTVAVTSISVSPASVQVAVGGTVQVSAQVATNGGTGTIDLGVDWIPSNAAIANVSTTGVVTGVAAGNTSVTARSKANASVQASIAVQVNAAAAAPNALLTLAVNPTSAAVVLGGSQPVSLISTASPGATVTYALLSSTPTRCTVPTTATAGLVSSFSITTTGTTGPCVITVTASATGTGLSPNSLAGSVAVNVTAQPPALQSLTVVPTQVFLAPGGTQVVTTTAVLASGSTVTYANSSSNTLVATVTPTGANPTITSTGNGTAQITITATGSGGGNQTNQMSAIVNVNAAAASVSISGVTTCIGAPTCSVVPVNLAGVVGQIEATLNIESGNQQIGSVSVELGTPGPGNSCTVGATYVEAERQIFGVNGAPTAPVTLSINTAEFNAAYQPLWTNGLNCLRARIFPVNGPQPDASNTYQFTLVNPDVVYFNASTGTTNGAFGLNHIGNSAPQVGAPANIWWKDGFTFRAHPVLYSGAANVTGIRYTSSACNGAGITALGPDFSATFSCAGVQSTQNITNAVLITYVPTYTLTASPTTFMTAASAGYVPGNPVWTTVTTREDNVGPTTNTPTFVAAGLGGWHGNGSATVNLPPVIAGTTYSVTRTDAGVGVSAVPVITAYLGTGTGTVVLSPVSAANQLPETLTPDQYTLRGSGVVDVLGNVGTASGATALFGVDLAVLNANYANRATSAFPAIFGGTNGTVYSDLGATFGPDWTPIDGVTDQIAVDAIDSRSGLDNPTALKQNIVRRNAGGSTVCVGSPAPNTAFSMTTILADSWVQSAGVQIDCGLAAGSRVGEYRWQGYVSDRAFNARKILRGGVTLDSVFIAIDGALPNITGIGFQTALYVGAMPATYSISANDDLELKEGQVTLAYQGASGTGVAMAAPIIFPFGSMAYTPTTRTFGTPFDGVFANVLNNQALTVDYYIVRYDFATAALFVPGPGATGNVAGFTTSEINSRATASVRDVANQPTAVPLSAPVLNTQLTDRLAAPLYATMIDWRITSKAGLVVTVRDAAPSSVSLPFCDRVDIYEAVNGANLGVAAAAGMLGSDAALGDEVDGSDGLRWRASITAAPTLTDNGFQRFYTYTSPTLTLPAGMPAGTGIFTAACVKSGSALLSPLF